MRRYLYILAVVITFVWPPLALADGLIPAINAYRNTPEFYFVFAVVVLIEAVVIRLWVRQMPLASVLWRILVLNAASSLAGYVLMRSRLQPDFWRVWQQAIPFFFLTLCVELPLLLILFRRAPGLLRMKIGVGTVANVLSYAFLILAERPIEGVWLERLRAVDHGILDKWADTKMLTESSGLIYGTESGPGLPHRLRFFNPREQKWHSLTNCPPIDPRYWDIEGDLAAFKHYQEKQYTYQDISVRRLPDFDLVSEISVSNAFNSQSGWDLGISPDRTKLAALVPLHEIKAPLRGSSYRSFGMTCDLIVYEISTGRLIGASPRKALRGVCWLPDSRRVLFTSLRDESLHDVTMLDAGWQKKNPEAYSVFADAPTYVYDTENETVAFFGKMKAPHLASEAAQLAYVCEPDSVVTLDPTTSRTNQVQIGRLGYWREMTISPDGRFAIVYLTLRNPMAYSGYPTIVDLKNPLRRYYLDGFTYRLDWTTETGGRTTPRTVQ